MEIRNLKLRRLGKQDRGEINANGDNIRETAPCGCFGEEFAVRAVALRCRLLQTSPATNAIEASSVQGNAFRSLDVMTTSNQVSDANGTGHTDRSVLPSLE